jgi:hypothetical protein
MKYDHPLCFGTRFPIYIREGKECHTVRSDRTGKKDDDGKNGKQGGQCACIVNWYNDP